MCRQLVAALSELPGTPSSSPVELQLLSKAGVSQNFDCSGIEFEIKIYLKWHVIKNLKSRLLFPHGWDATAVKGRCLKTVTTVELSLK